MLHDIAILAPVLALALLAALWASKD